MLDVSQRKFASLISTLHVFPRCDVPAMEFAAFNSFTQRLPLASRTQGVKRFTQRSANHLNCPPPTFYRSFSHARAPPKRSMNIRKCFPTSDFVKREFDPVLLSRRFYRSLFYLRVKSMETTTMKFTRIISSTFFFLLCLCLSSLAHAQGSWTIGGYAIINETVIEERIGSAGTSIIIINGSPGGGQCVGALYGASSGSVGKAYAEFEATIYWNAAPPITIDARVRGKARLQGNVMSTTNATAVGSFSAWSGTFNNSKSTNTANPFDSSYTSSVHTYSTSPTYPSWGSLAKTSGSGYGSATTTFYFETNAP